MAITFLQAQKRQKRMTLILVLIVLAIVVLIWWGFFRSSAPPIVSPAITHLDIKIDWQTLEDPQLELLRAFEEIEPLETEAGRNNPFIPY